VFVNAITEYVYDLSDRHEEFKSRQAEKKKPRKSAMEMFGGILPASLSASSSVCSRVCRLRHAKKTIVFITRYAATEVSARPFDCQLSGGK
jgi:hypothetical protein